MTHVYALIAAAVILVPTGTYLWFRAEKLLDRLIEVQRRVRGGYYRTIDPNAKCPSCGARNGEIFYSVELQRVVHTCHVDQAMWCEQPRIAAHVWDFAGRDLKDAGKHKEDIREQLARANTPIMPPKKEQKAEVIQ